MQVNNNIFTAFYTKRNSDSPGKLPGGATAKSPPGLSRSCRTDGRIPGNVWRWCLPCSASLLCGRPAPSQ